MKIVVNGEEREIAEGATLATLIELLQLPPGRIAVERNREVVPRAKHAETVLHEGDLLEMVRFMGGG
ncbi:MAG TPA: sulfur carrier protein ThiS [Candidatus Polarisedimenticolia bacterium]|nr:sulfur carrier protein ThiS [Candidatus Polarisedimenticolia bacterium]